MTLYGYARTRSPEPSSKASAAGCVAADRPSRPRQDLNVLILEDSPDDAELEVAMLDEAGYTCHWERVQTRDEFLARLKEPNYDLILADYSLPAFDGLSALKLVRAIGIDIPFILVSGTLGEETAIESLKAGATDYVLKPRMSRLVPVVQRALEERQEHHQRQQAEAALRASEAKLRLATTQMPAVLWTTDVNLRLTSSVGAALPLSEPEGGRQDGSSLHEVFQTGAADSPPIAAHRRALSGQSSTYEQRVNDRVFEARVEPLRDAVSASWAVSRWVSTSPNANAPKTRSVASTRSSNGASKSAPPNSKRPTANWKPSAIPSRMTCAPPCGSSKASLRRWRKTLARDSTPRPGTISTACAPPPNGPNSSLPTCCSFRG